MSAHDMESDDRAHSWPDERLMKQCRWEAFRASGPGGQKRNKTSSAIRIVHEPSGLSAIANESRSQAANRTRAMQRLRHRLALELRCDPPAEDAPLPPWLERVKAEAQGLRLSRRHALYLPVLALVLDVLAASHWSLSDAARRMGLTTAHLSAFLARDPKALALVNRHRSAAGLKPLGGR